MDYTQTTNRRRRSRQQPHARRLRNTIGILLFRVIFAVILIGGFAAAGAGIGIYLGILRGAPEIHYSAMRPGVYNSIIVEARTGNELARLSGEENREWVSIHEMPQHLLDAFVAIEDERFFQHNGIDIRSMGRALHVNLTTDRTEGASTITQQLIKNMQRMVRNDLISKLQEQYMAVQFERYLYEQLGSREQVKEHILEAYLNMINLGRNWHGVQVAAWNYFGKDVSELTLSESAVIAGITRNPSRYLPDRFPQNNRYRQLLVLDRMLYLGKISEVEHMLAVIDPVHDRIQTEHIDEMAEGIIHSYHVDATIEQVVADLVEQHPLTEQQAFAWVFGGGLTIYSTQDTRMQHIVDDVFMDDTLFPVDVFAIDVEHRLTLRCAITERNTSHTRTTTVRNRDQVEPWVDSVQAELITANDTIIRYRTIEMPQPQAAFVLMDHHNGHVLALSGGRGEKTGNRHFCRATVATRSPGSQFKVLAAFLPGVDLGLFGAGTHIDDEPLVIEQVGQRDYIPANWWGSRWYGPSSVRRAIYHSMNVVSVRAFMEVGGETSFQYLENLGFTTLSGTLPNGSTFRDTHPAVPLGGLTLGVTQLELAAAYATIANGGIYNRPVFYTRVLGPDGQVLLETGTEPPRRVITAQAAYVLTNTMVDTVTRGTGTRGRFRTVSMPISGKTGTSQNTQDLGFTGFTPYFTATSWLGFDTPQQTRGVQGAHLEIWRAIMERVHVELELPIRQFERPEGVVTGSICRISRMAPTDLCRRAGTVVSDLFVVGSVPTAPCDGHPMAEVYICALSSVPATAYCPRHLWIRGIPVSGAGSECPYHGSHNMDLFPDHGFFGWDDTNIPGLQPGTGDGFFNLAPPDFPDTPNPTPPPTTDFDDRPWWEDEVPWEQNQPDYNYVPYIPLDPENFAPNLPADDFPPLDTGLEGLLPPPEEDDDPPGWF